MTAIPTMFIGSSTESLRVAQALQTELEHDVEAKIWTQDFFRPGESTLETLLHDLPSYDFAVLVGEGDDITRSRGKQARAIRDNIIFELGLVMGILGRDRGYLLYNRDRSPKLPTDLAGITFLTYGSRADGNLRASLGPVSHQLRNVIQSLGRRDRGSAPVVVSRESMINTGKKLMLEAKKDVVFYASDMSWAKEYASTITTVVKNAKTFTVLHQQNDAPSVEENARLIRDAGARLIATEQDHGLRALLVDPEDTEDALLYVCQRRLKPGNIEVTEGKPTTGSNYVYFAQIHRLPHDRPLIRAVCELYHFISRAYAGGGK